MMEILVIGSVAIGGGLLLLFLKQFSLKPTIALLVIFPLAAFGMGYSLRLSGVQEAIDLGYFFTDFSFLFVYLVFSLALLLGQVRYWKK